MKKLILALALSWCTNAYAGDTVPFKAAIHTEVIPIGPCGPTCSSLNITGTGQGSHFGRMAIAGPSQIEFSTGIQTGTSTLSAPDGSTILISFKGTSVPTGPDPDDPFNFQGTWEVESGTGRFQGQSGDGTYEGSAVLFSVGVLYLDGRLSNPGKKK
jgi:hypothetical protein